MNLIHRLRRFSQIKKGKPPKVKSAEICLICGQTRTSLFMTQASAGRFPDEHSMFPKLLFP
jgi:hypothetical protein